MMGISYGGISQLFTAQTHPPSLAAIAPLSVIDATATTLEPGRRPQRRLRRRVGQRAAARSAVPAGPHGGQAWAYKRIQAGRHRPARPTRSCTARRRTCPATIAANTHYHPAYADTLDPITFVHKIHVPMFMACQFEDEQTGGHCRDLAQHFTGTKQKWFTFTNGVHVDSLDPETFNRWYDFLQLYVAKQAPMLNAAVIKAAAPVIYQMAMGLPQYRRRHAAARPDPARCRPTTRRSRPSRRCRRSGSLFDNGAGVDPLGQFTAGNPYPGFEKSFSKFPIPGTKAHTLVPRRQGHADRPTGRRPRSRHATRRDPHALPLTDFIGSTGGGGLWGNASQWDWNWSRTRPAPRCPTSRRR